MSAKNKKIKKQQFDFEVKNQERSTSIYKEQKLNNKNTLYLPKDVLEVLNIEEGYLLKLELKKNNQVVIKSSAGKQLGLFQDDD
ncbi:MAG: hypothetical protein OEL54_03625 [Flavobacteriaceae bacterium]|nr:hypothetical protein [Flavobacteriaceae bacterium]